MESDTWRMQERAKILLSVSHSSLFVPRTEKCSFGALLFPVAQTYSIFCGPIAQIGRAVDSYPHFLGSNPLVAGSNPAGPVSFQNARARRPVRKGTGLLNRMAWVQIPPSPYLSEVL